MLKFFNTLTRQLDDFVPLKSGEVKMYSCGPTVYEYAHIGNLRAYVFVDLLKRYLKYSGFKVTHVMNITDVDDKTILGSQKAGESLKTFTERYTKAFNTDLALLNIQLPDKQVTATTHITEMLTVIKELLAKGLAYKAADGSIYYKIAADSNYGQLAQLDKLDKSALRNNASGRLNSADEYEKESVNDFALWKTWSPKDGDVFWETELGKGRPGWHIECSAMSMKYLGPQFDIHTGGVDLIFPHHTNEIAQSEGATGLRPFVKYWLHNAHLMVNGQKMSKSKGNFYTLPDLVGKGVNPLLLRLIFIKNHYRATCDCTPQSLEEATGIARRFLETLLSLDVIPAQAGIQKPDQILPGSRIKSGMTVVVGETRQKFQAAMDDDLNVSTAFAALFEFIDHVNQNLKTMSLDEAQVVKNFIFEIDEVLDFIKPLYDAYQTRLAVTLEDIDVKKLLDERAASRAQRDFKKSDELRVKLHEKGLTISDTAAGQQARLTDLLA